MDLDTREAFGYYIAIFSIVVPLIKNVQDVYVDFGCRLKVGVVVCECMWWLCVAHRLSDSPGIAIQRLVGLFAGVAPLCAFAPNVQTTWERYYNLHKGTDELSPDTYPQLATMRILVNWMHAACHVLSCQLVNSGRFTDNAARRVGEMTEQLWALLKVQ
jgi:hypothetical protein